jgi:site-specific DNA-cytosine methylase
MNVLSLFDGISCGQIALEKAGLKVDKYFASELDKYAIAVTQNNYPNTIQLGDVCKIKVEDLPSIDLLIGGSPCQGFSFAGKQLNFNDPRSVLFFEYARILKEAKPKYFLLENVKMKKEFQDIISKELGVEPIEINSKLVSGQLRSRLYWTNIPNITQPEDKNIQFQDILEKDEARIPKAYTLTASYFKKGAEATRQRGFNKSQRPIAWINDNETRWLTPLECERLQTIPENYTNNVSNSQRYKMLGNGWTVDIIVHIFKNLTF